MARKILCAVLLVLVTLTTAACTSQTQYGQCIGALEDKKPELRYEVNIWNIVVGIIFWETIIIPAWVFFKEIQCPVEKKNG